MGEPVSRLPQVRKIQEVKDFRAAAAERQEISVRTLGGIRKRAEEIRDEADRTLGGIRKRAEEIRDEAETLQRLCENAGQLHSARI